jgi:hypothetical protein
MTADTYIHAVVDHVPPRMGLRDQIAMEVRSHIAERLEHGQPLADVLKQFGDPMALPFELITKTRAVIALLCLALLAQATRPSLQLLQ